MHIDNNFFPGSQLNLEARVHFFSKKDASQIHANDFKGDYLLDLYNKDIDEYYFDEIRTIIKTLADNNIEYPDITGYNFIEFDSKIWIIDFEHSRFFTKTMKDPFVSKFIRGANKWNPEFK